MKWKVVLFTLSLVLVLGAACSTKPAPTASVPPTDAPVATDAPPENTSPGGAAEAPTLPVVPENAIEFADVLALIEFNSSAGDLGFHVELDSDPFNLVTVFGPDGNLLFDFKGQGSVGVQGLNTFGFESTVPPLEELPRDEFLARFPEGEYTFIGETIDGEALLSVAEFTHNIPEPPVIISPGEGETVDRESVVIAWEPVTRPAGIEIELYSFGIFPVVPPEGQDPIDLNIDLTLEVPSTITEIRVPPELLAPSAEYAYEVVAIETGGNRTMTVGTFVTASPASAENANEFAGALPKIEYNALAGDLGFHVELDGDPFKRVSVFGPDGNQIFDVKAQGSVAAQGLTSFAFESAEPPLEELPLDEFLARFPKGDYTFTGETIEGEALMSVAEFTHNIPEPPQIISPAEGETVPLDEVVIAWEPVTGPDGIEIDVYLLQVFPVDPPEGQDPIDLNIDLLFEVPAFVTEVRIPAEFLMPGVKYQYEVTAVDAGGNQTLAGGTFVTAE